ncbi:hypothetical protein AB0I22_38960 [Streptomyces sp. NPDC050610]|uniref:hypothetical protein n=1 Tax=Streptomyces sp. NPDC050610 TaxID=3157097 RepID=UPI003445CD0F
MAEPRVPRWLRTSECPPPGIIPGRVEISWIDPAPLEVPLAGSTFWCERRRKVAQPDARPAFGEQHYADNASRALAWLRAELGEATHDWPPAQAALVLVWFRDHQCIEGYYNSLGRLYLTFEVSITARGYTTTWAISRSRRPRHMRRAPAPPHIPEGQAA